MLYEPKGEVKKRLLLENKERIMLQKLGGMCKDKSRETNVGILTESKAPRISTKVATKKVIKLS